MMLNRSSLFTAIAVMSLLACNKNNNNNNSTSNGTLSATLGGTAFTANVTAGAYLTATDQIFVIGYYIQNKDTSGIQVELPYLPPINHPFSTDSTNSDLTYVSGGKEYDAYLAFDNSQAVFTLTQADTVGHKIAGTFSGVLYNEANANDSIVITNGKFSTSYSLQ